MAYIYGQLEYCYLGVPIIRGYCSAKDLIFHSKAHPAYQRNADTKHIIDIVKFLKDSSLKFMPEIILAYDYTEMYKDTDQWRPPRYNDPIDYLYHGSSPNVTATSEKVSFQRLAIHTKGIRTIKIQLPDYYSSTDAKVFRRIDGNHRLEALEEIDLIDIVIPFCIVLLCSNVNATFAQREKDEMEIFHNINSKAKPLTPLEQYRGLFRLFNVYELNRYGIEFSLTKAYLEKYKELRFSNIAYYMESPEETVLNSIKFLLSEGMEVSEDDIADILSKLEHSYFCDCEVIRRCKSKNAIIPYVFYCMNGGKQKNAQMDAYHAWFVKNKLYNVVDFDAKSMVETFNSIYEIRKKQIFVAMPFRDDLLFVYNAIVEVVKKINRENNIDLEIPVRIDKQIVGFSYDIVEELLEQIKNAGLLIADLTDQNANVYYEAGYAQGLLKAKLGNTAEILYLLSNPEKPDEPFNAAKFDVQHYKMIPYKNDGNGVEDLKEQLEKELKAFYGI